MHLTVGTDVQIFVVSSAVFITSLAVWGASCHERNASDGTAKTWVWDSISEMITRSDKLRNLFVVYVFLSVVGFGVCLALLMARAKLVRKNCDTAMQRATRIGAWVAFAVAGLSELGFAVMSTDIDSDIHLSLASVAFGSLLLASVLLCLHLDETLYYGKYTPLAVALLATASAVVFAVSKTPVFEYALVLLLHVVFLILARVRRDMRFIVCHAMMLSSACQPSVPHSMRL